MKKRVLSVVSICIVLALSACSIGTSRRNTAFRNTCWGDDIDTIRKEEKIPIVGFNDHYFGDNQDFIGIDATVCYDVDSNYGLYRGCYLFKVSYDNIYDYISDYEKIKSTLVKTYGEPTETKESTTLGLGYKDEWIDDETNTHILLLLSFDSTNNPDSNTFALDYKDMNYTKN